LKFEVGFPRLLQLWRGTLHVAFAVLCLRYIYAVGAETGSLVGPLGLLLVASAGLGARRPRTALFAFAVAMPLLNGLPILGVTGGSPSSVFAALWLGWLARRLAFNADRYASDLAPSPRARPGGSLLATDLLITALLLSLGAQLWRHYHEAQFWTVVYRHTAADYGNRYYFLHSVFLWLQGLFYLRVLFAAQPFAVAGEAVKTETCISDLAWRRHLTATLAWAKPMFLIIAVTLMTFALIEYKFHLPEGWATAGLQSPFEDIFSFGGVAVTAFVFTVSIQKRASWMNMAVQFLYCAGLLGIVIFSWSRGSWLAAVVFLVVVIWLRLPRWCAVSFLLIAAFAVGVINTQGKNPSWQNHVYLSRLVELLRVEKLASKSPERLNLYRKAVDLIRERPFAGHGVGSFYLTSARYGREGDPYAKTPNFAHNVFLQIAAEQGVLVAGLFAGLIGWTLWRGVRAWQATGGRQAAIIPGDRNSEERLTLLGTTLALGVYVQTNLTSNSLNIYASNQFFFWFLMAAVLSMTRGGMGRKES
jgi:O-antigen ligase